MDIFKVVSLVLGCISIIFLALRYVLQLSSVKLSKRQRELSNKEKLFDSFNVENYPAIDVIKKETYFSLSYGIVLSEEAVSLIFSNKQASSFLEHIEVGAKKLKFDKDKNILSFKYHRVDKWLEQGVFILGSSFILASLALCTKSILGDFNWKAEVVIFLFFTIFICFGAVMFVSSAKGILAYKEAGKAIEMFTKMKDHKYGVAHNK